MKYLLPLAFLLPTATDLQAEETSEPGPKPGVIAPQSPQDLLALCPNDMPPACACVVQGESIRVMPANEAFKSRKKVLLVGPKTNDPAIAN